MFLTPLIAWLRALTVVCMPFLKMALVWLGWQVGIGWMAWSTARFYSSNCAPAGVSGFISSLFTMGSPVCIGAWFSHATFVVAYITAFAVAVLLVTLWLWNRITKDNTVKRLRVELDTLRGKLNNRGVIPKRPQPETAASSVDELE